MEKSVTNAWKSYNNNLNSVEKRKSSLETWANEGEALFIKLLHEMSKSFGYDYDEVQLNCDSYRPEAHANIENAQLTVLEGRASILNNGYWYRYSIINLSEQRIKKPATKKTEAFLWNFK